MSRTRNSELGVRNEEALREVTAALLAEMNGAGHWAGELSSSALSTATAPPRERVRASRGTCRSSEEVIDPEPLKACPKAWRCIGEEVTEQLDYEPAHFFKRRIVQRKYTRRDHPFAAPIRAPLCTLQDRCIAAPGLIAVIIVGKYVDYLPLYRQEQPSAAR